MPPSSHLQDEFPLRIRTAEHHGVHGSQGAGSGQSDPLVARSARERRRELRLALFGQAGLEAPAVLEFLHQHLTDHCGVVPENVRVVPLPIVDDDVPINICDAGTVGALDSKRVGIKQARAVADAIDEHLLRPFVGRPGVRVLALIFAAQGIEQTSVIVGHRGILLPGLCPLSIGNRPQPAKVCLVVARREGSSGSRSQPSEWRYQNATQRARAAQPFAWTCSIAAVIRVLKRIGPPRRSQCGESAQCGAYGMVGRPAGLGRALRRTLGEAAAPTQAEAHARQSTY